MKYENPELHENYKKETVIEEANTVVRRSRNFQKKFPLKLILLVNIFQIFSESFWMSFSHKSNGFHHFFASTTLQTIIDLMFGNLLKIFIIEVFSPFLINLTNFLFKC